MFKNYLLFHKALKEAADDFDFEEVRIQRKMYTFLLCIHYILEQKKEEGIQDPFVKTIEIFRATVFFKMQYDKPIVYNYVAKLERMGILEKVSKRSRIGKAQSYVTTHVGDYLLTHVHNHYQKAIMQYCDFTPKSIRDL